MFEQDYMMRQIKSWVRALLRMLFQIDTEDPNRELLESDQQTTFSRMIDSVENGSIGEAEDMLFEHLEESGEQKDLKMALLFYSYLNEKSDKFLAANGFSREEVKEGLSDVLSEYGLEDFAELFLNQ